MIIDLYSKRQKAKEGDVSDVYQYDNIPSTLLVQIIHIWNDVLGDIYQYRNSNYEVMKAYEYIVKGLRREYGVFKLPGYLGRDENFLIELNDYLVTELNVDKLLDVIELSFKVINLYTRRYSYLSRDKASKIADEAISELNTRFKEHGIGYQFIKENMIIRIDSELTHAEIIKPALRLLNEIMYKGAQEEFLSAFEHFRNNKNKEAMNDCLKAFESTMKAIFDKHKWEYQPTANAKQLIKICFDNKLIPPFWESQMTSLRCILESSIPTGRNKVSGHGQGSIPTNAPNELVYYMLNMTASTILFLASLEKDIKN